MTKNEDQKNAIGMQSALFDNTKDINTVLTSSNEVSPIFHGHFFQLEQNLFGIQGLITQILAERETFAAGIEKTDFRPVAIAAAMFTQDIIDEVIRRFTAGSIRYPEKTIRATLSVTMFKNKTVGKIQLKGLEDKNRPCTKSRCKWYLIK